MTDRVASRQVRVQEDRMTPSTPRPRPPWGWTTSARAWFAGLGALAAMVMLAGPHPEDGPTPSPPVLVVDPNTAPPQVLGALPKLGPTLVGRIVDARGEGAFRSLDDLDARVRGIGPATIAALRPHLRIGDDRPGAEVAARSPAGGRGPQWIRVARSP